MGKFADFLDSSTGASSVGSFLSGAFNLLGQRQQFKNQQKLNHQQQENALAQMAQSQEYNLANMATQNQYAIDAENRAREWNDIGAQASRARAAGISPLSALGSSSGGVLSQSSSPSSSTPSPAGASAGGASNVSALHMDLAQARALDADIALKQSQTVSLNIDNEIKEATKASQINIAKLTEKGINVDNLQKEFDYQVSQLSAPIGIQQQQQALLLAYAQTFKIYADAKREKALANSQIDLNNSTILLNASKSGLITAQTANVQADTKLKGVQMLLTSNQAEVSRLMATLTEQDIISKEIENEIERFRSDFEQTHKEKDWKRQRSNDTIQAIAGSVSGVVGSVASLLGAISPAGAVSNSIGSVISTVERFDRKGRFQGSTVTTTENSAETKKSR